MAILTVVVALAVVLFVLAVLTVLFPLIDSLIRRIFGDDQ